jgi:hypothetical protein
MELKIEITSIEEYREALDEYKYYWENPARPDHIQLRFIKLGEVLEQYEKKYIPDPPKHICPHHPYIWQVKDIKNISTLSTYRLLLEELYQLQGNLSSEEAYQRFWDLLDLLEDCDDRHPEFKQEMNYAR